MATKLPKGISFVKKLWHEKPDIAASLCLIGVGIVSVAIYTYRFDKYIHTQHRWEYTVIREEEADPVGKEKGIYN